MSEEKLNTQVVVGSKHRPCRGSYVYIYEPRKNDLSGKMEHSMCLLIPKEDKESISRIKQAMKNAIETKWRGNPPKKLRNPLRDGDSDGDNGVPDSATAGEEPYGGHYFMNVKNTKQIDIIDQKKRPSTNPTDFVSGDYCIALLSAYGYDNSGNRGISFGLNALQIVRKGEPLGNTVNVDKVFEVLEEAEDQDEGGSDDPFDI